MAEFTGERVIPGQVDPDLWNEHFARYAFAARLARRRRVLDIGCGTGYGAAELARTALSVTGIDVAPEALAYLRANYPAIKCVQASATAVPFASASFDLVVAFEVIEHLTNWRALLTEARRLLTPNGQLLVSTPNKSYYAESRRLTGPNPFHAHEFTFDEFREELLAVFPHTSYFLQNHTAGIVFEPLIQTHAADVRIEAAEPRIEESHFYVAVCAMSPQTGAPTFVYLPTTANVLREREHHIARLEGELATKNQWLNEAREEHRLLVQRFREQTAELEHRNQWALELNEQLKFLGQRVAALEGEIAQERRAATAAIEAYEQQQASLLRQLHEKCDELAKCVQLLDKAEADLTSRTLWAQDLERQLSAVSASRWFRMGRTLGLGPVLRDN
jgi:2-polyprenyl-3-methyl-5-hydroxy-6-metoxy-1,4-benzoquinol methylase